MTDGIGFTIILCTMYMTQANISIRPVYSVLNSVVFRQTVTKLVQSVLFTVLFSLVISAEEADGTLSTDAVLPSGTRLVIPQGILERYQADSPSGSYSYPYVYLFAHHFVTLPSKDAPYIPLSLGDGTKGIILWMNIFDIYPVDREKGVYRTTDDIKLSDLYR